MGEYKDHENIALTIEGQLETYKSCRNSTDRHRCLWHAWNHNKRWLVLLLEWAMPSMPSYSKHDASHAEAVLHNIEMLLGEKEIKKLSASDCFLILHVVNIHDIGMCITDQYRENLMKREDFRDFLKNCQGDIKLREYAEILLAHCRELEEQAGRMKFTPLQTKLKVYQAVIYLVAEFRRKDHSQES